VLVVNRFRVEPSPEGPGAATAFRRDLQAVLGVLARQKGYVDGRIGRNVDDPDLWVLTTTWQNVGSYRRALSAYEVKLRAVAVLSQALDEPSAYELVDGSELNEARPRTLG
jgi:hypothetical protein